MMMFIDRQYYALLSCLHVVPVNAGRIGLGAAASLMIMPSCAQAQQSGTISTPRMPLEQALEEIGRQGGTQVAYDPDAIPGTMAQPVNAARSVEAAIRQAIAGTDLSLYVERDGSLSVGHAIVVTARRDEAETSILVRQTSSSNRNGTPLRDQPRNAQVISSKLIDEQQATTVRDALRYAGGISGGVDTPFGPDAFRLRGHAVAPLANGLPGPGGVAGLSATGTIDTVERIEVLKGPDALLAGAFNLGGVVNVVTKKPSADFFAEFGSELGLTYGDWRLTGDVNGALTKDELISARVIASVRDGGVNYGGYAAAKGTVLAPSIRYKDASTDILLSASLTDDTVPLTPYLLFPQGATTPLPLRRDQPILGRDQGFKVNNQQFLVDATHDITQNITASLRYQHQYQKFSPGAVTVFGTDAEGNAFLNTSRDRQAGPTDAFDGFVRARFLLGPIKNTLNVGASYSRSSSTTDNATGEFVMFNLLTDDLSSLPPRPTMFERTSLIQFLQKGYFAQNLMEWGPVHFVLGVRRTDFLTKRTVFPSVNQGVSVQATTRFDDGATTSNAGIVVDLTNTISLFANSLEGFVPSYGQAFDGSQLPNIRSKNREVGIKADLFGGASVLNLSYFRNRQTNIVVADPVNGPPFSIVGPGQSADGFDVNMSGQILKGWTVITSYTRTIYRNIAEEFAPFEVIGAPRDTYSLYSNYAFDLTADAKASLGAGLVGRSSAFASATGALVSPPARQVDLNADIDRGAWNVRLGVRNLFDRENYEISFVDTQLPIAEPRQFRVTVGYKF